TLQWVYGFAADLLVFFPFGYSHHAVIVEIPAPGMPALGNGYFVSEEGAKVVLYDDDDRWLRRENRIDDIAEALEFLAREQRGPGACARMPSARSVAPVEPSEKTNTEDTTTGPDHSLQFIQSPVTVNTVAAAGTPRLP